MCSFFLALSSSYLLVPETAEGEWVIETLEEGVGKTQDFPLADQTVRTELLNELLELQAFCNTIEQYQSAVHGALALMKPIQSLVIYHEQPQAITRVLNKLAAFDEKPLNDQLLALRRNKDTVQREAQQVRGQLRTLAQEAQALIQRLEAELPQLFKNVASVGVVGSVVRDIRDFA